MKRLLIIIEKSKEGRALCAREGIANAANKAGARKLAPWAAIIARVDGGWLAFESKKDYYQWRRQS